MTEIVLIKEHCCASRPRTVRPGCRTSPNAHCSHVRGGSCVTLLLLCAAVGADAVVRVVHLFVRDRQCYIAAVIESVRCPAGGEHSCLCASVLTDETPH